jgi:hypothetical protein
MTDNDKIHARLMKLYELAKRGEHGERENAQRFLEKLLEKHGMTIADLDDAATRYYRLSYKSELEYKLLTQIICTVLQVNTFRAKLTPKSRYIEIQLTKAQHLEIEMQFAIYRREFARNIDRMFAAFIHTNGLTGPARDAEDDPRPTRTYSDEEAAAIRRMMRGIERTPIHKAIEG